MIANNQHIDFDIIEEESIRNIANEEPLESNNIENSENKLLKNRLKYNINKKLIPGNALSLTNVRDD